MISTDKYTKYDYLFRNVVPNPHLKIKIFGENDAYLKPQNYDNVTNLENEGSPVEAEVALVYLYVNDSNKKNALDICDIYRARKIENEHNTTVFEIAGTSERINARRYRFIKGISLRRIGIIDPET